MNNTLNYNVNVDLPISSTISQCENFSSSTSSAYEEISPQQHNGTPVSNDSHSGRQNQSTLSSKKSEVSQLSCEESAELTVDNLERTLTEDRASKVDEILSMLSCLNDTEKLLVQLRFPLTEKENFDESNVDISGLCDFGIGANQNEHSEALTWVMSHLEEDRTTCLKKQEVYEDYKSYCLSHNVKYLSTADFGKVMKKAFPDIKARRLGSRGQSKYCYSGLKNRNEIKSPFLTDVGLCCNKMINSQESSSNQEKNSDIDSNSSNCAQPDLSHVPEYELSSKILIDSALVIMDFVKRVGPSKNVTSLKQAVEHLLLNDQVETRSPHALRLLPVFQQMDSHKSKKKYLADQVFRNIKKEECLSNPNSVGTFQSSTTSSPQNSKRQKIVYPSPVADKVLQYYGQNKVCNTPPLAPGGYCHPSNAMTSNHNNNFNYSLNNSITQPFYNQQHHHSMVTMPQNLGRPVHNSRPEMSPITNTMTQKSFLPNTYSTPIKDSSSKNVSPTLNSPLLDRNPSTTKKLEIPKNLYQSNPISYPSMQQQQQQQQSHHQTTVAEKPKKLTMYSSPLGFHYEPSQIEPTTNSYYDADIGSPVDAPMTSRNYTSYTDDFDGDIDQLTMPTKRHIGTEYQLDYSVSPIINHYTNDNEYGANLSSLSSGYRHQSSEEKEDLITPGNSPMNHSTDQELSENSSRNNTPQNCSRQMTVDNHQPQHHHPHHHNKSLSKHTSYPPLQQLPLAFTTKNMFSLTNNNNNNNNNNNTMTYTNNNNNNISSIHHMMNYAMLDPTINHGANDEFSVSSTTNSSQLDSDRHPSTTMLLHSSTIYK